MSICQLLIDNITFTYPDSIHPVFSSLSAHFDIGWTGVVGANGSGKTTLLRIAAGELQPQHGTVSGGHNAVLCSQRTDFPPEGLESFLGTPDADACRLRGQLGIGSDWGTRWETLSHGERKRIQIARALWLRPRLFIADEPTNHIDRDTRDLLMRALMEFNSVGIIVSHDRRFLDTLCHQCLFLGDEAIMRRGSYSQGMQEQERERTTQVREFQKAKSAYRKLKRESVNRRAEASSADRKRSKRGLAKKDHDARAKKDLARVSGKDGAAGRRLKQLAGRLEQADQRLTQAAIPKEHGLGIWMSGSPARRGFLWDLQEQKLSLGEGTGLQIPVLAMRPNDRVGITGVNGAGKSTLITHIHKNLNISHEREVYIPQEISASDSRQLLLDVRRLSRASLGRIMEIVSRLNSRPRRLLETDMPSPGEIRKLMLARGILSDPHLIIMDEPTNHLDLPSIRCLEQALAHCPCGLLLVSHDRRFLAETTDVEWSIRSEDDGMHVLETNTGWA